MVRAAAEPYGDSQRVKGVLDKMSGVEIKLMTHICQVKAKADLEALGLGDELDNLFWRFEQKYRGIVYGKLVHSSKEFEGAEPYVLVAWKLVS
ncbi:hypothetical protein [Paenibacillus sonchi]|uniref:hypothetical protein n=1 Tax=Paenibacillus sonchi TaxID=373687 RepID=UPI001E62E147|nr:hypothetical protein [Paenibacillus sonchi]MCE3202481.1 hypothetical protein [Paenibacillus sonchi]